VGVAIGPLDAACAQQQNSPRYDGNKPNTENTRRLQRLAGNREAPRK